MPPLNHPLLIRTIVYGCCLLLTSCSFIVKTAVNKRIPQRSLDQIRTHNLEKQTLSMERLVRADVGVHLAAEQLDSVIDVSCKEWFKQKPNFNIKEINYVELKHQQISYDNQSIKVDLLVNIVFNKDQKPGKFVKSSIWRLQTIIAPRAQDSTMIVTASVANVKIEKLKLRGILQFLWVVKPVFNSLATTLRNNINGYLEQHPSIIPLKIKPLPTAHIADLVSSNQLKIVGDPQIKVNKQFGPTAIRITKHGIDLIAQMVDSTANGLQLAEVSLQSIKETQVLERIYKKELSIRKYHTNKVLKNISSVSPLFIAESDYSASTSQWTGTKIPKSEIPTFSSEKFQIATPANKAIKQKQLFNNPRRKRSRRLIKQEVPKGERKKSFDELFLLYSDVFNSKMISTLDSFQYVNKTEIQLSKQFITAVFNEVFADPKITFTYKSDFKFVQPPVTIELVDKPKFSCSSVLENCSDRLKNCNSVLSNCGSCSRWNIVCKAKQALCHAGNGLKWTACQVGNGGKYAACQVENTGKYAWCSTVFLAKYVLYEALKIGTYAARVDANINGQFSLLQASLGNQFDKYSLTTDIHAVGDIDAHLLFDGAGVTELFICEGINCRLRDSFTISMTNPIISGAIKTKSTFGKPDQLVIDIPEINIVLNLDNPLLQSLAIQCPDMFINCKVSRILAFTFALYLINNKTLNNYLDVIWKGRYNHSIDPFAITFDMPSMQLPGKWGVANASIRNRSVSLLFNP